MVAQALSWSLEMLSWSASEEHLKFVFSLDGQPLPYDCWEKSASNEDYAKILILRELLENGKAQLDGVSLIVPHEEICALPSVDQQLLDLPPAYPFDIRIDSDGVLNDKNYLFEWGFYEHREGKKLVGRRKGSVLDLKDGSQYLLSSEQLALCNALDEFNSLPVESKTFSENLIRFSEIKELSDRSASLLDEYLKSEKVIVPETISLRLKASAEDEVLEILPEVEGVDGDLLEKSFDRFPYVQNVYAIQDATGDRTRVVFTKAQQEELRKIKANRKVRGERKRKILEQPQEIFDPDIVDLDNFTKRVIEIGVYKPKFYPFISSYKSQWIPCLLVETSSEDRKILRCKTKEELEEFKSAIESSKREGKLHLEWKEDLVVPICEAEDFVKIAEEQFRDQSRPLRKESATKGRVLIIKENVEALEHVEDYKPHSSPAEQFVHLYRSPETLRDGIQILGHQKEGIAWLQSLCTQYTGVLLADDMGLGKTLQILAFLEWHTRYGTNGTKPYLIVTPLSLLENWEAEYRRFFDPCSLELVKLYEGATALLLVQSDQCHVQNPENARRKVVLTTYETLRKRQLSLCALDWGVAVLDEAQRIKTPGTLVTNAAKALKADFKVAVTGTPVENSLVDLWCIMDFVAPGLLGSAKEFTKEFQNPLRNQDTDLVVLGESLRKRIGLHIKRRLKTDVLGSLPPKHIKRIEHPMPKEQLERYKMEISQVDGIQGNGVEYRNAVLKALWAIRDISDHPYLPDRQIELFDADKLIESSAKLKVTCETIESIRERNEKVILFAERKQTQRMLAKVLHEKFGIRASIINGETPVKKQREGLSKTSRTQAIERFQSEPGFNAIVMSPLVAGVGLNITAANHVIHYTRHWNPAKEDQATDRVYRIGQEKEVYIYLPIAAAKEFKSFDVILDELLERKRSLASASLFPTERAEVTPDELFGDVFGVKADLEGIRPLTVDDIDRIDPYLFEAAVALLWQKQGGRALLTPKTNDKGADVVVFSETGNLLIQVKHGSRAVGDSSVGDILKSRGFYQKKFRQPFSLAIVTNQYLTTSAAELAVENGIQIFTREALKELLNANNLYLPELHETERNRMTTLDQF